MISFNIQGQSYYESYKDLSVSFGNNHDKNVTLVDSLIKLSKLKGYLIDVYQISHHYSLKCFRSNEAIDATKFAKQAVIIKQSINQYDSDYVDSLFRLGYFYSHLSEYEKAFECYDEIIKLGINPLKIALSYCEIGDNYYNLNDYFKSISYYKKGAKELESIHEYDNLLNAYENLSIIYNRIGTKESLNSQLELIKKADSLEKKINLDIDYRLRINNSYVLFYSHKLTYNFEKAKYYLKSNLKLALSNQLDDLTCSTYNNLANIYNLEQKDSALYFADKGISKCTYTQSLSRSYFQIADYYKIKNDYKKGLNNIQKGINVILDSNLQSSEKIKLKILKDNNDKDQLLFMLAEKNKLLFLQSQKERNSNYSKLALQHTLVADSLIDLIQSETLNQTKLHWREKASEIYTQGAELCYYLKNPETAFYLSEKGKAILLSEAILKNQAISKLPDSVVTRENQLKKTLVNLKAQQSNDETIKNKTFQAELNYEAYIDSIEMAFPKYFKNKSLQDVIRLSDLQKNLDEETTVISYSWPNSNTEGETVYALFITKQKVELLNLGKSDPIADLVRNFQKLVSRPLVSKVDLDSYQKLANQLYKVLLQPKNVKTNLENNKLIILPDGKLHNLPFEALSTQEEELNYLIKNHDISYAYSMSFLYHNSKIVRNQKNAFVGYAPVTFERLNLDPLKNSIAEINAVSSITNDFIFTHERATKSSFLDGAKDSKIIHLATHADATDNPWIAFTDEKLNLQELYTFKNNAELAVLSSCNTSIGKIATGEGVMSLARGFFYSGANSVVASLWNVNDKSSATIMEDFYNNLKLGETKSEALRGAKLKYIDSHSLSEASPYYWSSFILLGNTSKIELVSGFRTLHYFILGAILLIALFLFFRLKKK